MKHQACIGPGTLRVVHLRAEPCPDDRLVLCQSVAVFYDFKGVLDARKLCKKCVRALNVAKPGSITAADIGVANLFLTSDFAGE